MSSLRNLRTFQERYRNYTDEQYAQDVEEDCNRLSRQYMSWSKGFFTFVITNIFVWMFLVRVTITFGVLVLALVYLAHGNQMPAIILSGISVLNVWFLCKFFLFNACSIDKKASQDDNYNNKMVKKKLRKKERSELEGFSQFMTTFSSKHHALKVTMKLSLSIPLRTYYAYRTSSVVANPQTLNVYFTWVIISICLIPIMFTSKNDFFRRRFVILVNGTFDLVFGAAIPFYALMKDVQSLYGIDDFTMSWTEEWNVNVQNIAVYQRMYPRDGWGALWFLVTFGMWHIAYNQVFKDLRNDYTLISKARRRVTIKAAAKETKEAKKKTKAEVEKAKQDEQATKKETKEGGEARKPHRKSMTGSESKQNQRTSIVGDGARKNHRSSITVRHAIKMAARYQMHFLSVCFLYVFAFVAVVIMARALNDCPKECVQPLYRLFKSSRTCECYIWKADCTDLKLSTNESMHEYFGTIPKKTMFLSLYNCPLLEDVGASLERFSLTYLHLENTKITKISLNLKHMKELSGVAIINAPLEDLPSNFLERFSGVTKLEMSGTRLRMIPVRPLGYVRSLKLRNNPLFEQKELKLLSLKSLDLSGTHVTSDLAEMNFKAGMAVLIMNNCGLKTIGSNLNKRHALLSRLSFANNSISEVDIELLNRFRDYNGFNLTQNPVCQTLTPDFKRRFCLN